MNLIGPNTYLPPDGINNVFTVMFLTFCTYRRPRGTSHICMLNKLCSKIISVQRDHVGILRDQHRMYGSRI